MTCPLSPSQQVHALRVLLREGARTHPDAAQQAAEELRAEGLAEWLDDYASGNLYKLDQVTEAIQNETCPSIQRWSGNEVELTVEASPDYWLARVAAVDYSGPLLRSPSHEVAVFELGRSHLLVCEGTHGVALAEISRNGKVVVSDLPDDDVFAAAVRLGVRELLAQAEDAAK